MGTIFEEINRRGKDNKLQQIENDRTILKRAMVNNKGLLFYDEESIESVNQSINDKFYTVKKESKFKLKPIKDLIDELNIVKNKIFIRNLLFENISFGC